MKKLIVVLFLFPCVLFGQAKDRHHFTDTLSTWLTGSVLINSPLIFSYDIDTAYTNAVSKITGLSPISAVKASKDYFISADTSTAIGGLTTLYQNSLKLNFPSNVRFVSSGFSGLPAPYYLTLAAALLASSSGDLIYVYPGTYSDSCTISKDSISIVGGGWRSTVITGALYCPASIGEMRGLDIQGNMTFLGSTLNSKYEVSDCIIEGNLNVGTIATKIVSEVVFSSCSIGGFTSTTTKWFYFNSSSRRAHIFNNCSQTASFVDTQNLMIDSSASTIRFVGCRINFDSIYVRGTYSFLSSNGSPQLSVYGGSFSVQKSIVETGISVIDVRNALFYPMGARNATDTLYISNGVEFDIVHCQVSGRLVQYWKYTSISQSRFILSAFASTQKGIVGTPITLSIQQCQFGFSPVSGLKTDLANLWNDPWVDLW